MMQAMLAGVTTEIIQQYLEENKQLIFVILQLRNADREAETAEYEARLQRNLQYLAAVADIQSHVEAAAQPPPSAAAAQPSPVAQPSPAEQRTPQPMPYQQQQHRIPQSIVVAPSFFYAHQQQQLPQPQMPPQATMYSQLMANSGANSEFSMPYGDGSQARRSAAGSELRLFFKG